MRTLVQLLVISTAALTRVMTTKAKIEGMSTQSQNLSDGPDPDDPRPYVNPWTKDQAKGQCEGTDIFNSFVTKEGVTFGQCMVRIKDHGFCIMPDVPYKDNLDGKVFLISDKIWYCGLECSMEGHKCPSGSTCMPIPKDAKVPGFEISTKPEDAKNICYYDQPPYNKPSFQNKDKECFYDQDYKTTKFFGLTYGACYPTVGESDSCPSDHTGSKNKPQKSGEKSTDGNKFRCELPCNTQSDCSNGTICVPKSNQKLFGIQLQGGFTGSCLYASNHHSFDFPYAEDKHHAQCKDGADGVDIKEYTTTDDSEASICAPKAFSDGQCLLTDHPDGYSKLPISIKDPNGTEKHCQLSCDSNRDCFLAGSDCLTIKNDGLDTKVCLYNNPKDYEQPSFKTPGKECGLYEDYSSLEYLGLTYGACYPTVGKSDSCPSANAQFKNESHQSGEPSTDGKNFRCELPCMDLLDCALGTKCVKRPKPYNRIPGTCVYIDPSSHHNFESPIIDKKDPAKCKEAATNGEDMVEFNTIDGKKGIICAPEIPIDGKCPPTDIPKGYKKLPKAIKKNCQLPCDSESDCVGGSTCLTVKVDSENTKICLYPYTEPKSVPTPKNSMILYVVIGAIICVLVAVIIAIKCCCCKKPEEPKPIESKPIEQKHEDQITITGGDHTIVERPENDINKPQFSLPPIIGESTCDKSLYGPQKANSYNKISPYYKLQNPTADNNTNDQSDCNFSIVENVNPLTFNQSSK